MASDGTSKFYTLSDLKSIYTCASFDVDSKDLLQANEVFNTHFIFKGCDWTDTYAVGNYGDIVSLPRVIIDTLNRRYKKCGCLLQKHTDIDGYKYVRMSKASDDMRMNMRIHQLVANCFLTNPDNLPTINHIDGNKENNCYDNLEYVTFEDNTRHAYKNNMMRMKLVPVKCKHVHENKWKYFECIRDAEKYYDIEERYLNKAYHQHKCYQGVSVRDSDDPSIEEFTDMLVKLPSVPSHIPIICIDDNKIFNSIRDASRYYKISSNTIPHAIKYLNGYVHKINKRFEQYMEVD